MIGRLRRSLPIRWKLAITCAALTFVILTVFATVIGLYAGRQVRAGFDDDLRSAAIDIQDRIKIETPPYGGIELNANPDFLMAAAAGDARIRVIAIDGRILFPSADSPQLGPPSEFVGDIGEYRVVSRPLISQRIQQPVAYVQYAKPRTNPEHTVKEIRLFLTGGVIGGTLLALLAGLAIASRAMRPIAKLTQAAKDVARTRDPAVHELPKPEADDEVADLARTLEEMLMALDASRSETESLLLRQREFIADASHELRTPLTSVLSNLELLQSTLHGEDAEIAASALRSSRRMRRLVADLLLLARADAGRVSTRQPVDLRTIARDAVAEAAPLAGDHDLSLLLSRSGADPIVDGAGDDLHRLVLNLVENALAHTPAGTAVEVKVDSDGEQAIVAVTDDGPGIPAELRPRIFERFVRGTGDAGSSRRGGSGLGLAIVNAVAQSHDGSVELAGDGDGDEPGTRFIVRLPLIDDHRELVPPPSEAAGTAARQSAPTA